MVRRRQGRHDYRHAEFGVAGGEPGDEPENKILVPAQVIRSHGRQMQRQHHSLDLTPGCWPAPARRWSRPAATLGSSSPVRLRPALERDARRRRRANGGKVLGKVRHPLHQRFLLVLLQAQASKAKVIGLANAGGDTINSIKQASGFGIVGRAKPRRSARVRERGRARPAHRPRWC